MIARAPVSALNQLPATAVVTFGFGFVLTEGAPQTPTLPVESIDVYGTTRWNRPRLAPS
jgi:hypothetical protein